MHGGQSSSEPFELTTATEKLATGYKEERNEERKTDYRIIIQLIEFGIDILQ